MKELEALKGFLLENEDFEVVMKEDTNENYDFKGFSFALQHKKGHKEITSYEVNSKGIIDGLRAVEEIVTTCDAELLKQDIGFIDEVETEQPMLHTLPGMLVQRGAKYRIASKSKDGLDDEDIPRYEKLLGEKVVCVEVEMNDYRGNELDERYFGGNILPAISNVSLKMENTLESDGNLLI